MADQLLIEVDEHQRTTGHAYPAHSEERLGATLVLAHGAGAGHQHPFMIQFAIGLAARGVDVLTFNFLYAEQRRRVPDRTPMLEACYRAAMAGARGHAPFSGNAMFIGGKSMGGRIASHLAAADDAAALAIRGLVFLGYPLHPPGKPEQLRVSHLPRIRVPMLFVQGARDPFGTPDELRPHLDALSVPITVHVVAGGDHSLAPPKRGAASPDQVYGDVQDAIARWIRTASGIL